MADKIVTVKLPKNPDHDPHNKVTGPCPAEPTKTCTDVTGEHHTIVIPEELLEIMRRDGGVHITRVEDL